MIFGKLREYEIGDINPLLMPKSFPAMANAIVGPPPDDDSLVNYRKNLSKAVDTVIPQAIGFLRIVEPLWGSLAIDVDVMDRELFLRVPE